MQFEELLHTQLRRAVHDDRGDRAVGRIVRRYRALCVCHRPEREIPDQIVIGGRRKRFHLNVVHKHVFSKDKHRPERRCLTNQFIMVILFFFFIFFDHNTVSVLFDSSS